MSDPLQIMHLFINLLILLNKPDENIISIGSVINCYWLMENILYRTNKQKPNKK